MGGGQESLQAPASAWPTTHSRQRRQQHGGGGCAHRLHRHPISGRNNSHRQHTTCHDQGGHTQPAGGGVSRHSVHGAGASDDPRLNGGMEWRGHSQDQFSEAGVILLERVLERSMDGIAHQTAILR
jgi:hypothetical protein